MGQIREASAGVLNLLKNPLGQKTYYDIPISDRPIKDFFMRLAATVQIAAGTTNGVLKNRGSILAFIRNVFLLDGPDDVIIVDGKVTKIFEEMFAPRNLSDFARLADGSIQGPTTFYEGTGLSFGSPIFMVPRELYYKAAKKTDAGVAKLQLGFETVADARAALFTGNDRTVTVSALTAEVIETVDPQNNGAPQFNPIIGRLAQYINAGAAVNDDISLKIPQGDRLAALVVACRAGDYEVSDILTNLQILSDQREIRGITTDAGLSTQEQRRFGGSFPIPGYHVFNFVDNGRWGNAIDPLKDSNLRLRLSTPGVSATAGQNTIQVWGLTLRTVPGVTLPTPATR